MSKPTTTIYFNKFSPDKNGNCPVSLRVTYERKKKYYPTVFSFTPDVWERMHGERPRAELKENLIRLTSLEEKAIEIIKYLEPFTWEGFEKKFLGNHFTTTLTSGLIRYANELRQSGRIGTAVTCECAARSMDSFKKDAKYAEITPNLLEKYQMWMLSQGRSVTTVGMYLRAIRTVFNFAIKDDIVPANLYPFKEYKIPTGRNKKKALSIADISKIFNYEAEAGTSTDMAKDYWIFLYLANGMNVKDFCRLQYKNIRGDKIWFVRAKTARTKREVVPIDVPISEEMQSIINKWGNKRTSPETYIFPILQKGITPERERDLIQLITHQINEHLRKIGGSIEIENLTTYTARHSFATVLKRSGASVEYISESLGHTDTKTTQNYLAGFEDEEKRKWAQVLIPKKPIMKIAKIS